MKIDLKELKRYCKEANDLNIAEDKIKIGKDVDQMVDDFLLTIMRISDKNQEDKLSEDMVNFYDRCCAYHDFKAEQSISADSDSDFDRDDLEEKLTDLDFDGTVLFVEEHNLDLEIDPDEFEENQEIIIDKICDLMEAKSNSCNNGETNMGIEKELNALSFKELKAYVKLDPELSEIKFSKKEFEEDKKSIIEKILELKSEDSEENDDSALSDELKVMSYKEIKTFIKEKSIDIEIKIKDWKDKESQAEIIQKIIALIGNEDSNDSEPEQFDRDKIEEKLSEMDYDETLEFVTKNNLADEVSDFDEDSFDKEQEDLIEEILDILEYRAEEESKDSKTEEKDHPLTKALKAMDFKAFKDYVKKAGLADKVKLKKSTFDEMKDDLIKQILKFADSSKEEKPKAEKPKAKEKTPKTEKTVSKLRKVGNTVQEVIARVIKSSKGPISKDEIIKQTSKIREDAGQPTTSVPNFTNIVLLASLELGALIHDKKNDVYILNTK